MIRPQATMTGDRSSTASLMNRYGMPHSTETAANSIHARVDMLWFAMDGMTAGTLVALQSNRLATAEATLMDYRRRP